MTALFHDIRSDEALQTKLDRNRILVAEFDEVLYADDTILVSENREAFEELGGFDPAFEVYEDCEFIGRIYDKVGFVVLKDYVTTSARLYETNGTWRLQYHFTVIHLKHRLGATPNELSRYYKAKIQPLRPDKAAKMSLKS